MNRKKNKARSEAAQRKEKLKSIIQGFNEREKND